MYKYKGGSPAPLNADVASDVKIKNLMIISSQIIKSTWTSGHYKGFDISLVSGLRVGLCATWMSKKSFVIEA